MPTAQIKIAFNQLAPNNPVTITLASPQDRGGEFVVGQPVRLAGVSQAGQVTPVTLDSFSLTKDRVRVIASAATSFTLVVTARVNQGFLRGDVSIGTGTVVIGQVGNDDSNTVDTSKPFTIRLDV